MAVRLNTAKLDALQDRMIALGKLTLRVGVVGPGASALQEGSSLTLAELGALHEFGAPGANLPERAWMRGTLAARRGDIAALKVAAFKQILAGELSPRDGLGVIGAQIVVWLQAGIVAGLKPELATDTIIAKGSTKPLIDDGQFINSITYEVVDGEPGSAAA